MPPTDVIVPLIIFMALLLAASLDGLAASGHFPARHRAPAFESGSGPMILFGSLAIAVLCLLAGIVLVSLMLPWYAVILGGGGVLFLLPWALRPLSDAFINGRAALLIFAGASLVLVILLFIAYGWHVR